MLSQSFYAALRNVTELNMEVERILCPTNRAEALTKFLRDENEAPRFRYREVDAGRTLSLLQINRAGCRHSLSLEEHEILGPILDTLEQRAKLVLYGDRIHNRPNSKNYITSFRAYNIKLYGRPVMPVFKELFAQYCAQIPEPNATVADLAAEVANLAAGKPVQLFWPQPETIAKFRALVLDIMQKLLEFVPEDQTVFNHEEAVKIAEIALRDLHTGFTCRVNPDVNAWSVNHARRVLDIPLSYKFGELYSRSRLVKLLAHEIGVHIMRGVQFQDSEIPMLAVGVPGAEAIEEGIAACVEDALDEKFSVHGIEHYINIGLATFMDKNFCEVYKARYALGKHKVTTPEDHQQLQRLAFNQAMRCFRGTGVVVNHRDLAYYNGHVQVWQWIEQHIDEPDLIRKLLFESGKINFLNPQHLQLVVCS